MLQVDLGRLDRERRIELDAEIPPDAPLWRETEAEPGGPLRLRLQAEKAGGDVVVRGEMAGEIVLPCRRCLTEVALDVEEELALLFVAGLPEADAEDEGVYAFDPHAHDLDLSEPVREQVLLTLPQYAVCDEACRGLCATCGADLNETTCACHPEATDERWAALRNLKLD